MPIDEAADCVRAEVGANVLVIIDLQDGANVAQLHALIDFAAKTWANACTLAVEVLPDAPEGVDSSGPKKGKENADR